MVPFRRFFYPVEATKPFVAWRQMGPPTGEEARSRKTTILWAKRDIRRFRFCGAMPLRSSALLRVPNAEKSTFAYA